MATRPSSPDDGAPISARLEDLLLQSQRWGFLGPGPPSDHIDHTRGFVAAVQGVIGDDPPASVLDLGSGGGVPGLVLAGVWTGTRFVLLDANRRRTSFLAEAVDRLEWGDRIEVVCQRAEEAGRRTDLRGSFVVVVARSFGSPAVTAECSAPFLQPGGLLAVSEPPSTGVDGQSDASDRWPAEGCRLVGLATVARISAPVSMQVLRQEQACPERYPRRTGVPARRPLF